MPRKFPEGMIFGADFSLSFGVIVIPEQPTQESKYTGSTISPEALFHLLPSEQFFMPIEERITNTEKRRHIYICFRSPAFEEGIASLQSNDRFLICLGGKSGEQIKGSVHEKNPPH
jgi:hypothetical protein